jgi:hypothetical protein
MDEAAREGRPAMSAAGAPEQSSDKSPEELRRDIEETREQLGDTVEALAQKTDVKARAKQQMNALKQTARQKQEQARAKAQAAAPESASAGAQQVVNTARENPLPVTTAGAFLAGFLIGRWSK